MRTKYKTKKEADSIFLDLYNSGMYLPKIHKFIGSISIGTLHRWIWAYEDNEELKIFPTLLHLEDTLSITKRIIIQDGYYF